MPKATIPFGEWRPDLMLLDNQFANQADNVFPALNSYKPIPSLLNFTNIALPTEPAVGLTAARRLDGSWEIYAGSTTHLYKYSSSAWIDLTRATGGNYNVPPGELWSFAQFGSHLVAVNQNDDVQWADIEAGTAFVALPGSPPRARNVHTIGDFVVLGGLVANPRRIQWSGINDPTQWTVGVSLSDLQEFPDCGPVMGVAGDTVGYIVQDRGIRLMQFLPNDTTFIFQFSKVVKDKGSVSEFGFTTVADNLFFMAEDGPYTLAGNQLSAIGQDKCSEWWLANSDESRRSLVQVVASNKPYVIFTFYGTTASTVYDRLLIFNWQNQRWATGSISAQVWGMLGSRFLDLDTDGTEVGDSNLDSTAQSLDSFAYVGGRPKVCAIDANGLLCSLDGPNLAAIMQTAEAHLVQGGRAFVSEVYPLCDTGQGKISVETRERLADPVEVSSDYPLEVTGSASVLSSARLHRFKLTVPAGEKWTNGTGLLVEAQPDGQA